MMICFLRHTHVGMHHKRGHFLQLKLAQQTMKYYQTITRHHQSHNRKVSSCLRAPNKIMDGLCSTSEKCKNNN